MSKHLLKVNENKRVIASKTVTKSFEIDKGSSKKQTKIKKVTVYDEEKMNYLASTSFKKQLERVLLIIKDILSSEDATDSDYALAIDELSRLKHILNGKYKEFLKEEEYNKFLQKLYYSHKILEDKIIEYQNELLYNDKRGR